MIDVQQVTKIYHDKKVVNGVSFQINEGECTALIGPNGAGKSTLIDMIIGDRHPNDGQIVSDDHQLDKKRMGILFQTTAFPDVIKVKELFKLYKSFYKDTISIEDFKEITRFRDDKLEQFASKLSGGERRILDFALAIIGKPEFLILDEPTSAMDTEMRKHFWKVIEQMKQEGKTIFYTSHYIEEVERMADRVVVLNKGELVMDSTPRAIRHSEHKTHIQIPLSSKHIIEYLENVSVEETKDVLIITTQDINPVMKTFMKHNMDFNEIEISKESLMDTIFSKNEERI
ncbi:MULTISPECIES: ABC transporter ATP-binding protein [Mammaliicoccus]|uniref:ABC transporter ATP-binding protein n=1 Tax=Mammaliicoccus vitulinus TaxID=71237 RepID=A0ABX7HGW9_9STAP|nr:ABC transporter ATP-binding protein [Mammaliicoccus vitulinus]HAL09937.1 ABC transporter ATP-binding protein [Staphylococcus sp.]MBO3078382.1 ABC transporter ATP-binding protein [Mammaliicoccus vitulinus]PNZ34607.1 antibiotic ABC transporter ATP-binding protein [Mammaliicoccus vitulinus]PTI36546.1 ABC transporter ATP-binding protein [Mammaliicoccus vitulinus]PTI70353.1 ABC transporter ATP-binding protein [Mammaliicoccus vitulinus]